MSTTRIASDGVPEFAHGYYQFVVVAPDGSQLDTGWERSVGRAALLWNLNRLVTGTRNVVRIVGYRPLWV